MTLSDSDSYDSASRMIAPLYGKKFACFVASGMAAVELSLEFLKVGPGHNVLMPDNVCHTVPAGAVRVGARPNFAPANDWLLPRVSAIRDRVDRNTRAVVAVHQYGLPFPVKALREALPSNIPIVEDCAQAFGVVSQGYAIGKHSDLVVTSFGSTKPLSLGGGGALFGNDALIPRLMTRCRDEEYPVLGPRPYLCPAALLHGLYDKISRAEKNLFNRRKLVDQAATYLSERGFDVWSGFPGDRPSWARIPVHPKFEKQANFLRDCATTGQLVQSPHATRTSDLPQFANYKAVSEEIRDPQPFLIVPDRFEAFLDLIGRAEL